VSGLKVWFTLITQMGPVASTGKKFEILNRFFVLDKLKSEGLFDFIQTPKKYDEIIAHFSYQDIPYKMIHIKKIRILIYQLYKSYLQFEILKEFIMQVKYRKSLLKQFLTVC
jgi:hypothetical protein